MPSSTPTTKAPARPTLKRTFTATAFGLVTARNAWRAYFQGLAAEQRARREAATPKYPRR